VPNQHGLISDETSEQTWFDCWPDGLIGLACDYKAVVVSPSAVKLLGWSPEELIGKHIHEFLCAKSREFSHDLENCPLCENLSGIHSGVWRTKEGVNCHVDFRMLEMPGESTVSKFLSFHSTVENDHCHDELETFADYVEKNPGLIVEFDEEAQMLFGNAALHEQLLEKGFGDYGQPNIFPQALHQICQSISSSGKEVPSVEIEIEDCWYRWSFYSKESNQGQISVVGFANDITEHKQLELRFEKEKLEARRDFIAKMVHELRTPLNAIIGFSQILIRITESKLSEREFSQLKNIHTAGVQLNEMVSDTLDVSKIDAGKMELDLEAFSVSTVISSIHEQMKSLSEAKHLEYLVECDTDFPLYSDRKKLRQIVVNLVSNAIKYTEKGSVRLSVGYCEDDGNEEGVQINVVDSGIGIPKEQIGSLFHSYQQVSGEKTRGIQGTGLGLTLVSELANMLKAQISVKSELGLGSRFTVKLPKSIEYE